MVKTYSLPRETSRRQKSIFLDALRASPIGIALEDLNGQLQFVNPALCKLLGRSEEEMLKKHSVDFSPRREAEQDWACFEQMRAGIIDHYQLDKHYFRRDGSLVWGQLTVWLLNRGSSPLVMAMVEDITERQLAESKLQEYEKAVEGADEMIIVLDRDYRYLIANRTYLTRWKLRRDQVIGHYFYEVVKGEIFEAVVKKKLDECFRGKVVRYELKYAYPEVGERDLLLSYFPIKGTRGVDRAVCIVQDITDRKRAEKALYASEERLRLSHQAARMGTFEVNLDTGLNTWTPELEALYGLSPGGFPKTREAFFALVHPEDREEVSELFAAAMKSREAARGEWRIVWPDGSIHWIAGRWQVFMNQRGEPSRILGVNSDITERKNVEEALMQMHRRLLATQEEERARIGRELHDDINQRLAMLTMEVDKLQLHFPRSAAERTRCLAELRERLIDISTEVQSVSHQLHPPQLEYLGIAGAMKSFCREFGARQMLEIDFKGEDIGQPVPQEISLCLFRVLQEAVHNAARHSRVRHLEVALSGTARELRLTVSDRGTGFNVEAALKKGGLGLISMQERVRLIGGSISIQTQAGLGTTVDVRVALPKPELLGR